MRLTPGPSYERKLDFSLNVPAGEGASDLEEDEDDDDDNVDVQDDLEAMLTVCILVHQAEVKLESRSESLVYKYCAARRSYQRTSGSQLLLTSTELNCLRCV